jgi:nucleotide-binding universal stress UspA family protein
MNFRHLLVPSDGSVLAAAALPIVRVMATTLGAELTVAMVLPPDAQPGWTRGPADYLQEIAAPLRAAGVAVHTTLRVGDPAAVRLNQVGGTSRTWS